jgi:hypothetical protein
MHLLAILQVQAANILYGVSSWVAYEDIVKALKGCYQEHQLAGAYWS